VSALGHYLEEEGIATVAISLIRPQTENTKPPRALWVPFELGRPFGPPSNPAFQRRVILAALRLVERQSGPVIIEDFPEDDPRAQPDPAWRPPVIPAVSAGASAEALAAHLEPEIGLLRNAHDRWVTQQHGRTTVGLSGLSIADCGRSLADWLCGKPPPSPREGFSPPLMLRFAVDDIKAYYLEAGAAGSARPSSRQLGDWFWNETAAGAAIHALRAICQADDDERLKLIAGNFMVPATRVRSTG
jgi:hypothetical protein